MNPWRILKITETTDTDEIRMAYMQQLSHNNPEDNLEGFQNLRSAYEEALRIAQPPPEEEPSTPIGRFMHDMLNIYLNFFDRINIAKWEQLLESEVVHALDTEEKASHALLLMIAEHHFLPHKVWLLLDAQFGWTKNRRELCTMFPHVLVQYVCTQVEIEALRYELFSPAEGVENDAYEDAITIWTKARKLLIEGNVEGIDLVLNDLYRTNIRHPDFELLEAEVARINGNFALAHAILKPLCESYPNHGSTLLEYAILHQKEEKIEDALKYFKEVLAIKPSFYVAKQGEIECLMDLNRYHEARDALYQFLGFFPTSMFAVVNFSLVNKKLEEEYLEKYENGDKSVDIVIALARFRLSIDDSSVYKAYDILRAHPEAEGHTRYPSFMAECLSFMGKFEEAYKYYKLAIQREPFSRTYVRFSGALLEAGRPDEALEYALKGQALDDPATDRTNKARLHQNEGQAYYEKGDFKAALECYYTAEEIQPFMACLNIDKANVYKVTGRLQEAVQALEKAMSLAPYDPKPYYDSMEIYYASSKYDEMADIAKSAERCGLEHPKISYYHACALRFMKKNDEAEKILRKLIKKHGNEIEPGVILSELAYLYWSTYETKKCEKYIKQAIKQDPEGKYPKWREFLSDIYEDISSEYVDNKRFSKALKVIFKAVKLSPKKPSILIRRGILYLNFGRYDDALKDFLYVICKVDDDERYEILTLIGDILTMHHEKYEEARHYYDAALEIQPNHENALHGMAEIVRIHDQNYTEALELYANLLELHRLEHKVTTINFIYYLLGYAKCLDALGETFEARKYYNRALQATEHLRFPVLLEAAEAEVYHYLGKHDEAEVKINKCLADEKILGLKLLLPRVLTVYHEKKQATC